MDVLDRLNVTLESRFPAFSNELFNALKSAGLSEFPEAISDEQVAAAVLALGEVYDLAAIEAGDFEKLFDLFAQETDQADARTFVAASTQLTNIEIAEELLRRFVLQAATFNDELNSLLDSDEAAFEALYAEAKRSNAAKRAERERVADRYRFFNEPEAVADFATWVLLTPWSPDQAIALSLGKNPDVVNADTLAPHIVALKASPFAASYRRRLRYLQAAIKRGDIKAEIYPNSFLRWAFTNQIEVDKGLYDIASKTAFAADEMDLESDNAPTSNTWRALAFGLLRAYYDFPDSYGESSNDKTPFAGRVLNDLGEVGVPLSDKPLRAAMRAAAAWARDPKNEVGKGKSTPKLWRQRDSGSKPANRKSARP